MIKTIKDVYDDLFEMYGSQGWWPLLDLGEVTYRKGSKNYGGYHPGNYEFPKTTNQIYEVCIGAVLAQNVGWVNAEKALNNLKGLKALNPEALMGLDNNKLKEAIKPAGYFNQKARKLKEFTRFFLTLTYIPKREELLNIWGIGPETADSMLLYAFKTPTFVVDAYTKRIFANLGFIKEDAKYDEIKALFEGNLKSDLTTYQEYHALIVEHAKRYYAKKGEYHNCPLYKKYVKAGGKKGRVDIRKAKILES